jgi:glycosyltransferase involved in cell wall biosynthesis
VKRRSEKISYHGALAPLQMACEEAGWAYVDDLMAVKKGRFRKLGIALRHFGLLKKLRSFRANQPVLVRDFSNLPLRFIFPFLSHEKRRRLFFVVNHNLQWALKEESQKRAFIHLARQGCRFCFFERVPEALLKDWGIDPTQSIALPHPVGKTAWTRERKGGVETIGVIGEYRPEKGIDDLLDFLKPLASRYRILLAIPNIDEFSRDSSHGRASWFDRLDTSSAEAYQQAVAGCDLIVLNHAEKEYLWRASGLIADAVSARVPVLVRNLPVLSAQCLDPVPVGACFRGLSELPEYVEVVSNGLKEGKYDFSTYQTARSGLEIAHYLEQIF